MRFLKVALFAALVSAEIENRFSAYPKGSQDCLNYADRIAGCNENYINQKDVNKCICQNEKGFLVNTVRCIEKHDVIEEMFNLLNTNCRGMDTPLVYTLDDMEDIADGQDVEPKTPEPTTTDIPEHGRSGLSTGAIVGIAVGCSAAVLIVLFFLFLRYRKRNKLDDRSMATVVLGRPGAIQAPIEGGPNYHGNGNGSAAISEIGGMPIADMEKGEKNMRSVDPQSVQSSYARPVSDLSSTVAGGSPDNKHWPSPMDHSAQYSSVGVDGQQQQYHPYASSPHSYAGPKNYAPAEQTHAELGAPLISNQQSPPLASASTSPQPPNQSAAVPTPQSQQPYDANKIWEMAG